MKIFEGKQQQHPKDPSDLYLSAPHHLVVASDLHPVHARLDGVETAVKGSSTVIQEKVKKLDSLSATAEDLSTKVQELEVVTKDTQQKVDQIDLSKIEGLDPATRKYLRRLQTQVQASQLNLSYNSDEGRPDFAFIGFNDKKGNRKGTVAYKEGEGLRLGAVKPDEYYSSWITLSPNGDILLNGKTFVKGSETSVFDTIAKALMPSFLSLIQGRTTIRCALLKNNSTKVNEIINGTDIISWSYPWESSDGYMKEAYLSDRLAVHANDLPKKWQVVGYTFSYYAKYHWLQEVIDPDTTFVLKTVGSSTLADNFVDLKAIQQRLATIETSTTSTKAEIASNRIMCAGIEGRVDAISDKTIETSGTATYLKERLGSLEQRIQALEPIKEKFDKDGDLILAQQNPQHKPSITFTDMNGKPTNYLFIHDDNFFIAKADKDGNMGTRINLTPEKITIDNHTIQEHIKEALRERTGVFAASLKPGVEPRLWDVISGKDVLAWQYPCEEGGRTNNGWNLLTPGEPTWSKKWRVCGKSDWDSSATYYLQEVI